MNWQIINTGTPRSEPVHHALDELLLEGVDEGTIPPTLRFWYRETPAVPLGRFQAYEDEVAVDYVDKNEIPVVRRITGGGAMYVDQGDVITYSMYLPRSLVPEDVEESYATLNEWVLEALRDLGLEVSHEPLNDIAHPDGKIGGAAQLRKRNAVLHHATMSYSLDLEEMLRTLRIGEEKLSDKAVKSAEKRVTLIDEYTEATRSAVIDQLIEAFQAEYGGELAPLDDALLEKAEKRADKTFRTDNWNKKL